MRDQMNEWRMKVTAECVAQGHSMQQGCPACCGKGLQPLSWDLSRVVRARVAVSGIANLQKCCPIFKVEAVYRCGCGPHNITWRAASWTSVVWKT